MVCCRLLLGRSCWTRGNHARIWLRSSLVGGDLWRGWWCCLQLCNQGQISPWDRRRFGYLRGARHWWTCWKPSDWLLCCVSGPGSLHIWAYANNFSVITSPILTAFLRSLAVGSISTGSSLRTSSPTLLLALHTHSVAPASSCSS